jgi:hypothetical protein
MTHDEPIFVAGPDRSGTSLIFAFLASHPNISMVRRTNMWRYFHRRYGDLSRPENFERCLHDMVRYNRMKHLSPDADRIRREFQQGQPPTDSIGGQATYGRLFALFHKHHAERRGKQRWGDKSLHTEHYVDRVVAEYPNARIIHMVRDPRDRYASVRKRHGKDSARVGAATARWLVSMRTARRNLKRYPDQYLIVRYEDLASQPEETLRRICAFIHEAYTPAMLAMDGAPEHRDTGGNSSFGQIEPGVISTSAIGRFRKVLSSSEIAFIQMFAGRDMEAFGYEREPVRFSLGEKLTFYLVGLPVSLARMLGWLALTVIQIKRGARIPAFRLVDAPQAAGPSPSGAAAEESASLKRSGV